MEQSVDAGKKPAKKEKTKTARFKPKEKHVLKGIRQALSILGCRLFRNTVGAMQDRQGRWWSIGLGEGSSDLIGYTTITIQKEHVGHDAAIFTAVEVKRPEGKTKKSRRIKQEEFIRKVQAAGGIAFIADDIQDAIQVMEKVLRK